MKMLNSYYCVPQSWTLAQILAHMNGYNIDVISVLTGSNNTPLVGLICREELAAGDANLEMIALEYINTRKLKAVAA